MPINPMTIQEAIQLAVNNGYPTFKLFLYPGQEQTGISYTTWLEMVHGWILLDPLFWQALGKGMGWENITPLLGENMIAPDWQTAWHKLIDHVASGKSIEDFFANLIKE